MHAQAVGRTEHGFLKPLQGFAIIHIGSVIKVYDKYGDLGKVISRRKGGRFISTRGPWRLLDGSRLRNCWCLGCVSPDGSRRRQDIRD